MKSSFEKLQTIASVLDQRGQQRLSLQLWTAAGAAAASTFNVKWDTEQFQPSSWRGDKVRKFGQNNEGFLLKATDLAEAKKLLETEHRLNPAYLKITEVTASAPVQSSVVTAAAKLGPASDPWVHRLALLPGKQDDAALVRLRGIATMPATSQNFASFQRAVPDVADAELRKLMVRFCDRVKSGKFDDEFRRRYSKEPDQQSLMRDLFRYFRVAYDYVSGGSEAGVAEVEPSRETVALAQRALKTISTGKPMSHANAQQVLRQLEELQQQFKQDFNGAWFARQ